MMRLTGDLLAPRQDSFDVGKRHRRRTALVALDYATDHFANEIRVFVVERIAFCFANFLNHHLLGCLGTDSAYGFLGVEDLAIAGCRNFARLAINLNDNFGLFAVMFFSSGNKCRFDALEDDFLLDVFVAMNGIDDSQHFGGIHNMFSPRRIRPPGGNQVFRIVTSIRSQLKAVRNLANIMAKN